MKNIKLIRLAVLLLMSLSLCLALASCDIEAMLDNDDHDGQYGDTFYTVTYDSNGGSYVSPSLVERGDLAIEPYPPTRPGYIFRGWYKGSLKWNFDSEFYEINNDITLTAKWEKSDVIYTVTFDSDGGTSVPAQEISDGFGATAPAAKPKKDGYRFGGWYVGDTAWNFDNLVTSDMTLVARWIPRSEYLVYDCETTPLHIVYSTSELSTARDNAIYDLFTKLSGLIDVEPTLAKDGDRVPIDNEIVVGNTMRTISSNAKRVLNMIPTVDGEYRFLIYVERSYTMPLDVDGEVIPGADPVLSKNGYSVAIVYDASPDDFAAAEAVKFFIDNYATAELAHAPGVVYYGSIDAQGNVTEREIAPSSDSDPAEFKVDFESAALGSTLPTGFEVKHESGKTDDPESSITVAEKDGNKYIKIITWDTYVFPGSDTFAGWEPGQYRDGYANLDLSFKPTNATEEAGYFVMSFDMTAESFYTLSDGAGSQRAGYIRIYDENGTQKGRLPVYITEAGYVVSLQGGSSYQVLLGDTVSFRFVYNVTDGKVYCFCNGALLGAVNYGTAGASARLGSVKLDFANSLAAELRIDNVICVNNVTEE